MAKIDWEEIQRRVREQNIKASPKPVIEKAQVDQPHVEQPTIGREMLKPAERRKRMLNKAEEEGVKAEAIALLSMVGAVEGFTNISAIYNVPNQTMIDAERMKARNAINEGQARGRAWNRLRKVHETLDNDMRERGTGYHRPSDWMRLFAVLKKATNPGGSVPNVFAVQSSADRSVFRAWANQYELNGDGLVHAGKMIRQDYEDEMRKPFNEQDAIARIQSFTAEQLNEIVRAGFEDDDTYVQAEGGEYIPMKQLPERYDRVIAQRRSSDIAAELDQEVGPRTSIKTEADLERRNRAYRRILGEYDARHFHVVGLDRNSGASENGGIVAGVFAVVNPKGNELTGYGYHGIIQPELLNIMPKEYIVEERGKPYVREHDGKTVVHVQPWLFHKNGIRLLDDEEVVPQHRAISLEHAATRKLADGIIIHRDGEPYWWNDVHWVYKRLVENRLPFLAKLAGVDPLPTAYFKDEEAEKDWMHERILSSGATTKKQLEDKQKHFELTLEDVFMSESDRAVLYEVEKQFPETLAPGGYPLPVNYKWNADMTKIEKAVIEITKGGHYDNTFRIKYAGSSTLPVLGNPEHPVPLVFRYEYDYGHGFGRDTAQEFPADRLKDLLKAIEPQEQFLNRKWSDFIHQNEIGKMDLAVTITVKDVFPTAEIIKIVMEGKPVKTPYAVDRDGIEHDAYATMRHKEGDEYHIVYVQTKESAEAHLVQSKAKHAERVAVAKAREEKGGHEANPEFLKVKALQAEVDTITKEFETDNLVAYVLGTEPLPPDEQKRVQSALEENKYERAQLTLRGAISDREMKQEVIDSMRKASATVTELIALGFDWDRFNPNKSTRRQGSYDEYDDMDRGRKDSEGFYPGDIQIHKSEVYLPTWKRHVGHRLNDFRLRRALPDLQRRLDYELEIWKMKKEKIRKDREEARKAGESIDDMPEVIERGVYRPRNDDEDDEGEG